jgi:nucleotide-binding universal stress UspA family protein
VAVVLLEGSPATTLAEYVRDTAPDLVVMTTHGRGGASRLWLGSVTEGLVRRTTVPVLALRPPEGRAEPGSVRELRHVLVAVDGSVESEAVIAPVVALFGHADVDYTLLRGVPPLHPLARAVAPDWEYSRDLGQEQRLATRYLEDLAERLHGSGVEASILTRCNATPVDGIVAVAEELGVDVVALATHGRGPVGRFVFGSVADKVLRTSSTAVLLYHAPAGPTVEPQQEAATEVSTTIVAASRVEIYAR